MDTVAAARQNKCLVSAGWQGIRLVDDRPPDQRATIVDSKSRNKSALGYMVGAVMLYSTLPIAFSLGGASQAPFLFIAMVYFCSFICNVIYLRRHYPEKAKNTETIKAIKDNLRHPALFWVTLATAGYLLFSFSLRLVDEAIAAVIMATSYTFTIFLIERIFKKEGRYEKVTIEKWILLGVALVGVGFVILSQISTIDNVVSELFTYTALGGAGLLLIAAFLAGSALPAGQKWGAHVSRNVNDNDETFYTIVANAIGKLIATPVMVVVGFLSGETSHSISGASVMYAASIGFLGMGIGAIWLRIANAETSNLGINALGYLTPAVSLIWLGLASLIDIPRVDWLIIGVTAVIITNLLLNFATEIRAADKVLIVALWMCGMTVYLHNGFPLSGYAVVIGLVAPLFVLMLVFRAARLQRRPGDEGGNWLPLALGVMIIATLLFFKPPNLSGWNGLFTESGSFLLAVSIAYLFADMFSLEHDRAGAGLRKDTTVAMAPHDGARPRGETRWVPAIVCTAVTVVYIWLFLGKWVY